MRTFRFLEMDNPSQPRKHCKFWSYGGKCQSPDAPKVGTSRCIGTKACSSWEEKSILERIGRKSNSPDQ